MTGSYDSIIFGQMTNRQTITNKLGKISGKNKKNGLFEILYKDNVYYYVGFGVIGFLQGIKISELYKYKLDLNSILKELSLLKITYEVICSEKVFLKDKKIYMFFKSETIDEHYLEEVIKANDFDVMQSLCSAPFALMLANDRRKFR